MLKTVFCTSQSVICTHIEEKSLLWITNLKGDSFSVSFLPGKRLLWPLVLCWIFPAETPAQAEGLPGLPGTAASCSWLRCESDLRSLAPGEDAAEQRYPCLHSFKLVPGVFPSPSAARPPHRLTKGRIHQWAATSYNPFERQQAVPAPPRFVLESSCCLAHTSPEQSELTSAYVDGFGGLRMDWGSFPSMLFVFFRESNQLLAVFALWEQEPCSFSSPVTERQYSSLGLPIILLFSWTELNLPAQRLPRTHWEDDCSPTKPRCQEHSCKSKGRANHSSEVEQGGELPADVLDEETDCGGYVKTQTKKKKSQHMFN